MTTKQNGNGRTFDDKPATRERVPLWVDLSGCSGSGKTFSALRLATGMQRVTGGDVHVIDTEARRALHYADRFKFRHLEFAAPFGPLDYLAAIEHCVSKGARNIVIDSGSHEHEGPGGVLEMHEAEVQRLSRGDSDKAERVKMLAWSRPKQERRRLINTMLQMPCNFVICYRAKEKLKIERGKEPTALGWMPIAGEEWIYEATVHALLPPGSGGVPIWRPGRPGEQVMVKLPEQFKALFAERRPLDEATGEAMAKWAAGESVSQPATNGNTKPAPAANTFRDRIKWPGAADWTGRALSDGTADALSAYRGALVLLHEEAKNDRQRNGIALHLDEVNRAIVDADSADFGDDDERAAIEAYDDAEGA